MSLIDKGSSETACLLENYVLNQKCQPNSGAMKFPKIFVAFIFSQRFSEQS